MKTAVSVPDKLFKSGDALAKRLGVSRSRLYSDALADMIAPPPPPTKDQAERMERVAEEQQTQTAAAAESKAAWDEIDEQIRRDKAARELEMREGRTVLSRGGRERDDDRGRERDR